MDISLTTAMYYGGIIFTVLWMTAASAWAGYRQGRWRERDNHKRAGQHADDTLFRLTEKLKQMQQWEEPAAFLQAVEIALDDIETLSENEVSPYNDKKSETCGGCDHAPHAGCCPVFNMRRDTRGDLGFCQCVVTTTMCPRFRPLSAKFVGAFLIGFAWMYEKLRPKKDIAC